MDVRKPALQSIEEWLVGRDERRAVLLGNRQIKTVSQRMAEFQRELFRGVLDLVVGCDAEVPEFHLLVEKRGECFAQGWIDPMRLRFRLGERLT